MNDWVQTPYGYINIKTGEVRDIISAVSVQKAANNNRSQTARRPVAKRKNNGFINGVLWQNGTRYTGSYGGHYYVNGKQQAEFNQTQKRTRQQQTVNNRVGQYRVKQQQYANAEAQLGEVINQTIRPSHIIQAVVDAAKGNGTKAIGGNNGIMGKGGALENNSGELGNTIVDFAVPILSGFSSKGAKSVFNFAKDLANGDLFTLSSMKDPNRYFRIVAKPGSKTGDAILDATQTGIIRSTDEFNSRASGVFLRSKNFGYPMFSKGEPWKGATAGADAGMGHIGDVRIIRSKEKTPGTVWEESNKDFRHKGHTGIFRPNYAGNINAAPASQYEWFERYGHMPWNKWIWKRHQFTPNYNRNIFPQITPAMQVGNRDFPQIFGKHIGDGSEAHVFENPRFPEQVLKIYDDVPKNAEEIQRMLIERNTIPNQEPIYYVGTTENGYPVVRQKKLSEISLGEWNDVDGVEIPAIMRDAGYITNANGAYTNGYRTLLDINPFNIGRNTDGELRFFDVVSDPAIPTKQMSPIFRTEKKGNNFITTAKFNGKTIGKLQGTVGSNYEVHAVEVAPEYRRRGIATQLYKNAQNSAIAEGKRVVSRSGQHQFTGVDKQGRRYQPATKLWQSMISSGIADRVKNGYEWLYFMR